jgi:hypothetical protein
MAPIAFGVLLLLGVILQVGAPPTPIAGRPPEDIVCHPNGIYGYAEHDAVIVQEKETWFQLDISSPNLHECIRRCYGYRFCYSLTYDHTREKPCIFYLHASDKCPGKDLVNLNEIEYQNKPVSVACLKCGEPKNPQSQSSAKKTDDKPALEFSEDEHSESVPAEGEQPVISESKDDNIQELVAEAKPPATTVGYRQSCIVTFQVFMNEDINAFKTTRIATVSTINECAYICYQNSCSGAIYVPSSDGKAQCKVQMRENEKCNSRLQRHYTFTHDKAVVLSCFRCQPDKPITLSPDAEIIRATTTPRPELTKGRLTTIAPEKAEESLGKEEGPVPPPESSNKVEDTPKTAKPPAMAPTESGQVKPESNAAEEPEVTKPSGTDKSVEKEEEKEKPTDKPEATAESAEKAETSKPSESKKPESAATDKPKETEKTSESSKSESTTPSKPDTSGKTVSLGKVTSGPVDFGGCLITFQADYLSARPSEFKSEFELNLNVESPEICATRCYQDGCTGALYMSNNGTCVLGYGDKHHCNKRPLINFLSLKDAKNGESLWIHCTSCRSGKYGATGSVTGNMNNNKVEMGEQLSEGKSLKAVETTEGPHADATTVASKTEKPSEKVTEEEKPAVTEKPAEDATKVPESEATKAATEEEKTTAAPKDTSATAASSKDGKSEEKVTEAETEKPVVTEKPTSETTITSATEASKSEVKPSSSSKAPEKTAESPSKPVSESEKPHKSEDTDGTQGCLITFQAGDLAKRPKEFTSEFELNLHTETPEICATRCYQDGCTGALFFPKNGTCILGYGDKQYCDKSPILRFYKHSEKETHKESLWIHCTVCRSQRHGETFEPVAEEKLQIEGQNDAENENVTDKTADNLTATSSEQTDATTVSPTDTSVTKAAETKESTILASGITISSTAIEVETTTTKTEETTTNLVDKVIAKIDELANKTTDATTSETTTAQILAEEITTKSPELSNSKVVHETTLGTTIGQEKSESSVAPEITTTEAIKGTTGLSQTETTKITSEAPSEASAIKIETTQKTIGSQSDDKETTVAPSENTVEVTVAAIAEIPTAQTTKMEETDMLTTIQLLLK